MNHAEWEANRMAYLEQRAAALANLFPRKAAQNPSARRVDRRLREEEAAKIIAATVRVSGVPLDELCAKKRKHGEVREWRDAMLRVMIDRRVGHTAAAESLGMAQQSVSGRIRKMRTDREKVRAIDEAVAG